VVPAPAFLGYPQKTMKNILIVDDDERIRQLLLEELGDEGFQVSTARNGHEALSRLAGPEKPDLIILDLRMPGMNGLDTIGFLLKLKMGFPMIIYSAYGSYANDSLAMAADAYVVKSSDLSELKNRVHELTDGCPGQG